MFTGRQRRSDPPWFPSSHGSGERKERWTGRKPQPGPFAQLKAGYAELGDRLVFENVTLRVSGKDYRAAAVFDDVSKLMLDRFNVLSAGKEPVIVLNDVERAIIRNSPPPANAVRFIEQRGKTKDVGEW